MSAGGRAGPAETAWRRRLWWAAGAAAALAMCALLWTALRPRAPGLQRASEGTARPGAGGIPEISMRVAGGEYTPNVIHAAAGRALRLRITRSDPHGCADQLLVPDLGIALELPERGEGTLLVPAARGAYLFTCGARMVKGVLLFE